MEDAVTVRRDEALASLQGVFREVFDDESLSISEGLRREDLASWDSLGHIRLVAATEEFFGVNFTIEEIETMVGVAGILDLLVEKSR